MNRNRTFLAAGLLVSLFLAGVVSWYASSAPDGLERVATDRGFIDTAQDHPFAGSPFADYAVSWIGDERLSGGVAGIAGVLFTFLLGGALFLVLRRRGDGGATRTVDLTAVERSAAGTAGAGTSGGAGTDPGPAPPRG